MWLSTTCKWYINWRIPSRGYKLTINLSNFRHDPTTISAACFHVLQALYCFSLRGYIYMHACFWICSRQPAGMPLRTHPPCFVLPWHVAARVSDWVGAAASQPRVATSLLRLLVPGSRNAGEARCTAGFVRVRNVNVLDHVLISIVSRLQRHTSSSRAHGENRSSFICWWIMKCIFRFKNTYYWGPSFFKRDPEASTLCIVDIRRGVERDSETLRKVKKEKRNLSDKEKERSVIGPQTSGPPCKASAHAKQQAQAGSGLRQHGWPGSSPPSLSAVAGRRPPQARRTHDIIAEAVSLLSDPAQHHRSIRQLSTSPGRRPATKQKPWHGDHWQASCSIYISQP